MGLIETEFTDDVFAGFVRLLVSRSPVPVPRLGSLGPDRLIAGFEWGQVTLGSAVPGLPVAPGKLSCSAPLRIHHVTIAELAADPNAAGATTEATAYLTVRATTSQLIVELVGIGVPGKPPELVTPPVLLEREWIPALPLALPLVGAAIVRGNTIVTLRLATAASDDLLRPPSDRLKLPDGGWSDDWLIHVDGQIFADLLVSQLADALDPPPSGTTIEDAPSAAWIEEDGEWSARGGAGVLKEDACPTLFGSVDLSVGIEVTLGVTRSEDLTKLLLDLHIESNVSDWDSFRCWAGSGLIASALIAAIPYGVVAGIGVAIASLLRIGETIRLEAGAEVSGTKVDGGFTQTGSGSQWVDYHGELKMPQMPKGNVGDAHIGADGLVVSGSIVVAPATHVVTYTPEGALSGTWSGHYSCGDHRWEQTFDGLGVIVTDAAQILGKPYRDVSVTVFDTSSIEPPDLYALAPLANSVLSPYVGINVLRDPIAGDTGRLYLHTSAGIRRFEIESAPPKPAPPPEGMLRAMEVSCRKFQREWPPGMELKWLVDPPWEGRLLRQWMLVFRELPAGGRVTVSGDRGGDDAGVLAEIVADRSGAATIELITDADIELRVDHTLTEVPAVRLAQRWLAPIQSVDLPPGATRLVQQAGGIAVVGEENAVLSVHEVAARIGHYAVPAERLLTQTAGTRSQAVGDEAGSNFSISLPDGRVAAMWDGRLLIAVPSSPRVEESA